MNPLPAAPAVTGRNIELKDLRFFVRVVDIGSITRASQALHIAQPALSKHLAALEHALDAKLLIRGSQGIQATEQGSALYAAAQRILRDVDAIALEVAAMGREPVGTVRIGLPESTSMSLAYPLASAVLERYPSIRLEVVTSQMRDLYRRLINGDLDLVVITPDDGVMGVQVRVLVDEELFVTGAHSMPDFATEAESIAIERLTHLPFILPANPDNTMLLLMQAALGENDFDPRAIVKTDSLALVKRMTLHGRACAILPWTAVQDESDRGSVRLKRVQGHPMFRRLALCRRPDRPATAAVDAVAELTVNTVAGLVGDGGWRHATLIGDADWK